VDCADARQCLDAGWNGVGEAHRFQEREHRFVDALEVVLAERLVSAAFQSGANGADIIGKRRSAHRTPGFPAAGASRAAVRVCFRLLQCD
jgi:hypothetical protein